MAKKKLGMSVVEVNKQFSSQAEAYKYAKRLKEFIRYTCQKNAHKGWYAQAIIVSSNTNGKVVNSMYYEKTGNVGRPKRQKDMSDEWVKWYGGNIKVMWHLHIILVSKPKSFNQTIKDYIDKNWIELPNLWEKKDIDFLKIKKKKVYKKNCNIGLAEYVFLQSEDILFCDYNFTGSEKMLYSLKDLFKAYMEVETFKKHNGSNYWLDIETRDKVNSKLDLIMNYFWSITEEQDKKEMERFIKLVKNGKIAENYEKEEFYNNIQEGLGRRNRANAYNTSIYNNVSEGY